MKHTLILVVALFAASFSSRAADHEEGFTTIFDGKTLDGWKTATEHPETWKVENGELVAHGERCHLYYVGDAKPFKNFENEYDKSIFN